MYDENSVQGIVGRVVTDSPVAIRLTINPDNAKSLTSAVVDVGATTITITYVDKSDATIVNVYDLTELTTIGALADKISALPNGINARVLDALRSDSVLLLKDGTYAKDLVWDTSNYKKFVYRICANREFESQPKSSNIRIAKFYSAKYNITLGAAGAGNVKVYRTRYVGYPTDYIEQELYSIASVSATETNVSFGEESFISANIGDELVIVVKDATSIADLAGNFLEVRGTIK